MAKQYWVGEFYVDLSRNQISQLGQSQTLPPKALSVLTLLAKNRGKVVTYDEILDEVWADSVVTPNTLQRSIAQLRKALGENSKAQEIIKTHAKQGYSLECDVNWSQKSLPVEVAGDGTPAGISQPANTEAALQSGSSNHDGQNSGARDTVAMLGTAKKFYGIAIIAVALVLFLLLPQLQNQPPKLQLGDLRYLTSTDDKEFGGTYSPDGRYILFHRYINELCINNIWAKDAETLEEIKLTQEHATYGQHSLSPDGETLAFIQQEDCSKPVSQTTCYKLMSLDFNDALRQQQTPKELLECQDSRIRKPIWIDKQHIALLQNSGPHWRLIRYSVTDNASTSLFAMDEGRILTYAWSYQRQLFAVTSIKADGRQYIEMLYPDGTVKSSHPIHIPPDLPRHQLVAPEFIPNTELLIFGDGNSLYTLSEQGKIEQADFQPDESVGAPYFHPDGKRLLLIKGTYDSDVARLPIPEMQANQQPYEAVLSAFERSTKHEDNAKFQPGGELVAFVSARTGSEQVWIQGESGATILTDFPKRAFIPSLYWNKQGDSILVLVDMELQLVALNKDVTKFDFAYPILDLFHWDSDAQHALANVLMDGAIRFVKIDLNTLAYQAINNKKVHWAAKSQDGAVIFLDSQRRFWQTTALEDKLIAPLTGQLAKKQRFLLRGNAVYGVNDDNQLWSYDLQSDAMDILAQFSQEVDYLTDVNDGELLLTFVIAAKKEVVELSLRD